MDYLIPKYLDVPERYLFWTVDEAIALIAPLSVGLLAGHFVLGLVLGPLCMTGLKRLKGNQGEYVIVQAFYWYLQTAFGPRLKVLPPSYVREYLG